MRRILVSGLVNVETTVRVRQFPIAYYPIDYPFFGIDSAVSGVAYNIALALKTLGDEVRLCSMLAPDLYGAQVRAQLVADGIDTHGLCDRLRQTPASVVLYDEQGRRQIYCDLKDVQETSYPFLQNCLDGVDVVVACNTNFNRPLLHMAREAGKIVATDVHVLGDVFDEYNREFLQCADIVFLSDEAIGDDYRPFLRRLAEAYPMKLIVLGRGGKGAAMYRRESDSITQYPAAHCERVVNTVGAGDALFSAFVHAYAQGLSPEEALLRAQLFAARKIETSGASRGFIDARELERLRENC